MNYYPNNFYQNYQPPQSINSQYSSQLSQQYYGLQGKVVENEDVVRVTEVPFGSYGVFPKTDLKEIYLKTWNNNGTTKILTYKPIEEKSESEVDTNVILLEKINQIEDKIDKLFSKNTAINVPIQTETKKKEVKINNEY